MLLVVFFVSGFFALLEVAFLAGVFFALVFFALVFFAVALLERVVLFTVFFWVFLAAVFFAAGFLDAVFLRPAAVFRVDFDARADVFFAELLREVFFVAMVFLAAPVADLFVEAPREPDLRAAVFFAGLMGAGR